MTLLADVVSIVAIFAGAIFFLAGTLGLLRFPDTFTRLHALTKADNLGLGLVVLGLLPRVDGVATGLKLVVVWLLVMLAGACASQMVARTARREAGHEARDD
jgi:multicomponent Na+:H+ antiporter subunit G